MTSTTPAPSTDKNLDAACASVTSEIARTDSKASLLLAFNGVVLAGLANLAGKNLPLVTKSAGGLAVLALATAAVLLLLVVRPCLTAPGGRPAPGTFPHWAHLEETELQEAMGQDHRLTRVKALSILAVRKFRRLALAVDLTLTALALLALAAAGTAL
ncbi:Pycsar system effector family protein [Streptomyces sp. TRM 70351]|uniref:Pycsar system effector family protein n=1 Tax=Streptomyces sp. TRM 70351 TaxID=3116552 RepID=UPI002E7B33FE|nr:Pycsar system effector family protein [Streptomyces sp. TRM 70351]MEE1931444.1 Pycsar system effector family protein [Streptomyces sp. TRM 70351]